MPSKKEPDSYTTDACGKDKDPATCNRTEFHDIAEFLPQPYFETNELGTIIFANSEASAMFGYTRDEIISGIPATSMLVPEDRQRALENIGKIAGGQQLKGTEYRARRKDGTALPVIIYATPIIRENKFMGIRGLVTDITESKKVEDRLRISEERLKTLIGSIIDYIYIVKVEDGVPVSTVHGTGCLNVTGYTSEEYADDPNLWYRMIFEEDRNAVIEQASRVLSGQTVEPLEHRVTHKDGSIRWVKNAPVPRFDGEGRLAAYDGMITDISERKLAEKALQESETMFRALSEDSTSAIFLIQGEKYLYINPAFTAITGYTMDELAGMNFWDIIHPDMRELVKNRGIKRQKHEEEPSRYDLKFVTKTGEVKFGNFGATLIEFHGKPAILGSVLDITERRQAEEELQRLALVVRHSSELVNLSRPDGTMIFLNEAGSKMLGIKPDEVGQINIMQVIPGHLKEKVEKEVLPELLSNGSWKGDLQYLNLTSGELVDVSTTTFIIKDPNDGKPLYLANVSRDITERKQAEKAIQESEEKYRSITEGSIVGVYIIQDNLFRYVNRRFCEISGYSYDEIVDRMSPADFVHDEDRLTVEENLRKRLQGEVRNTQYKFRMKCKDGRIARVEVIGGIFNYLGKPAAIGTLLDTTKETLIEEQLQQAQKMEAIGQLAGGIAHDFNNILTTLVGYSSLLQLGLEEADPLQMYIEQIISASQKATNLTGALLTFSRQQPANLLPLDINNVIRGTEKLLKRLLTEDIALEVLIASDEATVMADATQIDQILFNLVTNARDAMPGGGRLIIETSAMMVDDEFMKYHGLETPGKYHVLSVSDTGCGMDEEARKKIFDPFFTTKEVGKGTGLGLATVYGIVKQHGGQVTVYSEPGRGTTFRIYFPAIQAVLKEEQILSPGIRRGTETILVAEDNEEVRDLMKDILTKFGYTVLEAMDGQDAIDRFRQHSGIDLLIMDAVMPRKNGRESYEEIHAIDPDIKVIFISGYTRDIVLDKGIEEGDFHFIPKPLSPTALLHKVRAVLDGSGQA